MFPAGRNHDTSAGIFFGSSRKVGGANKSLGEAPKSCTRKEHESATNSIAKRGQGGTSSLFVCPLQGQGTASLVGFGATPQLFRGRSTQRKKSTKGAGSEASLPVTLRVRRRAPNLLFQPIQHCRARWARLTSIGRSRFLSVLVFFVAGISPLRRRPEGFAVALWTASPPHLSYLNVIAANFS